MTYHCGNNSTKKIKETHTTHKSSTSVYPDPSNMSAWSVGEWAGWMGRRLGGWFLWFVGLGLVGLLHVGIGILWVYGGWNTFDIFFVQYCSMCYMCLSQWVGGITPFGWQRFIASGSSRLTYSDTFLYYFIYAMSYFCYNFVVFSQMCKCK